MKKYFVSVAILFLMVAFPIFAEIEKTQCGENLENYKAEMATALYRLEQHFVNWNWQYAKYRELVYVPLWRARLKRNDRFSPALRAEGEILEQRHQHDADVYLAQAHEESAGMVREWKALAGRLNLLMRLYENHSYRNCLLPWRDRIHSRLLYLKKLLRRYSREQKKLADEMMLSVDESPNDHTSFATRFQETLEEWNVKVYPTFLENVREIREEIEHASNSASCCKMLADDKLKTADPVLNTLRPDPQGAAGISGRITNQANLVKAFDELEKESETQSQDKS